MASPKECMSSSNQINGTDNSDRTQQNFPRSQGVSFSSWQITVVVYKCLRAAKYVAPSEDEASGNHAASPIIKPSLGIFVPLVDTYNVTSPRSYLENISTLPPLLLRDIDPSPRRWLAGIDFHPVLSEQLTWLEELDGNVDIGSESVAYCHATLIRRKNIANLFYDAMAATSHVHSSMAFELFDRFGRLKDEHRSHPVKKGSAVWQDEMDNGDILLITALVVDELYSKSTMGCDLLVSMLRNTFVESSNFFAIAHLSAITLAAECRPPEPLSRNAEHSSWPNYNEQISKGILRFLGFKRLGITDWFIAASDTEHKSHELSPEEDFDPSLGNDAYREDFCMLISSVNADSVYCREPAPLIKLLIDMSPDDPRWHAVDRHGNNLMHVVALHFKPYTMEIMMRRKSALCAQKNIFGESPLEALQYKLERLRTQRKDEYTVHHVSDDFEGHHDGAVRCLEILQGSPRTEISKLRLKYGCTCGGCQSGLLSPRMRLSIMYEAQKQHRIMLWAFQTQDGAGFAALCDAMLEFIPPKIVEEIVDSIFVRDMLVALVGSILDFLMIPQPAELDRINIPDDELDASVVLVYCLGIRPWNLLGTNFIENNQLPRALMSAIFKLALMRSEGGGDGGTPDAFRYGTGPELERWKKTWRTLPECRNDCEYGFVSSMLGYEMVGHKKEFMDGFLLE
jgi:hypothetical protein